MNARNLPRGKIEPAKVRVPLDVTWLRWAIPAACLALAIASVPVMVLNEKGLPRYRALQAQLRQIDMQNAHLERRVRTLSQEVEGLTHDTDTIERAARERFGMVKDDELVFLFPE